MGEGELNGEEEEEEEVKMGMVRSGRLGVAF